MKKIISLAAVFALVAGYTAFPAEAEGYEDFIPQKKYENLIPDASDGNGSKYFSNKPHPYLTRSEVYDTDLGGRTVEFLYDGGAYSISGEPDFEMQIPDRSYYEAWKIFGGFDTNRVGSGNYFNFSPVPGKTYVFSANVKNASAGEQEVKVGLAMARSFNASASVGTDTYGKTGMSVGKEWTKFSSTITIPDDWPASREEANEGFGGSYGEYFCALFFGMPAGVPYGAAFRIDVNEKDSVYFAEEQLYDITNTLLEADPENVVPNEVLDFSASVINQTGGEGTFEQNFNWYALDSERNIITDSFEITNSNKTASVRVKENITPGTYYIVAESKDYAGMRRSVKLNVEGESAKELSAKINEDTDTFRAGTSFGVSAKVLNQAGKTGTLKQDILWSVLDEEKNAITGFSISGKDGSASVLIDEETPVGKYYINARSEEYGFEESIPFNVIIKQINENPPKTEDAANIIQKPDNSGFASATSTQITRTAPSGASYITIKANTDINNAAVKCEGLKIRTQFSNGIPASYEFVPGKSYVIKARVRKNASNGDVYFNMAMGNETPETLAQTDEYGEQGMKVGDGWTEFAGTFTVSDNYDPKNNKSFVIGLPNGTPAGAAIDIELSVYIAEAVLTEFTIESENGDTVREGEELILSAKGKNQLGGEYPVPNGFNWYITNSDHENNAENIFIEKTGENSAKVSINEFAAPGTYYAAAQTNDEYRYRKLFGITVDKADAKESVIKHLNADQASEIENNLPEYMSYITLDDTLSKSADLSDVSKLIEKKAKTEKFTSENVEKELNKLFAISLYNKNANNIKLYDENGDMVYEDILRIKDELSGTTLYDIFKNTVSKSGKEAVNKALSGKTYRSEDDFYSDLKENIILQGIYTPEVMGTKYIEDILTDDNAKAADINITKYSSLRDKTSANNKLARNLYTKRSLENAISELGKEESQHGSGSSGSSGSSSGSSKNNTVVPPSVITDTPQIYSNNTNDDYDIFEDVRPGHWAYDHIYHLKKLAIVDGIDGTHFLPDGNVTREQFVKMFVEAFDYPSSDAEPPFEDVMSWGWYRPYISSAYSNGLINGISEGIFGISRPITRQDICVIVYRAIGGTADEYQDADFTDADDISDYALDAVGYLAEYGIINGFDDGSFRPKEYCTRAQAAKIVCTLINLGGIGE